MAGSSVAKFIHGRLLFLAASVISICGLVVYVFGLIGFSSLLLSTQSLVGYGHRSRAELLRLQVGQTKVAALHFHTVSSKGVA